MFIDVTTVSPPAVGDGTTPDNDAFEAADLAGGTIYVPRGTYFLDDDLTLSSDIRFEQGATLKLDEGVVVTLNGSLDAGVFQVFDLETAGDEDSRVVLNAVEQMLPQWWGAVATGVSPSNDGPAIQAAIDACSVRGGRIYFPPGHYRTTQTLTIRETNMGIALEGPGERITGAVPANNLGAAIEYAGSAEALEIAPSIPIANVSGVRNVAIRNLAIQATATDYAGTLVMIKMLGFGRFENVAFQGLPPTEPPLPPTTPAKALVAGNGWIDVQFKDCFFRRGVTGLEKIDLNEGEAEGWGDFLNAVHLDGCWFELCETNLSIEGSAQAVSIDRSSFEPAPDGRAATVKLAPSAGGSITRSWFGDSNGTGTWIEAGGVGCRVVGNFIAGGADRLEPAPPMVVPPPDVTGIEVLTNAFATVVESNVIHGCSTSVLVKGSRNTRVADNQLVMPDAWSGETNIGVDVVSDVSAVITNNLLYPAGTGTLGYALRAGSAGILNHLRSASTATFVDDDSGGAWTITTLYDTTFASAVTGFNPSRFANVKSATDQATAETDGRINFNYVVGRYAVESQGYFALTTTGSGNPATSTRFIGGASTTTDMYINAPSLIRLDISGNHALELNMNTTTNDDSAAVLLVRQSGSWTAKRVYQGAADSAGTGRRRLEVDN